MSYAFLWALLEPILALLSVSFEKNSFLNLIFFLVASLVVAIYRIWPSKEVEFTLKNTNTRVKIKFGDLLKSKGVRVISVNEFFDSKIGDPVSLNSLHGVFLNDVLGGYIEVFDDAVSGQLEGRGVEVADKPDGKNIKYNLGDSVVLEFADIKYILCAIAKTDHDLKAYTSPSLLMKALDGLWKKVRTESNGYEVNIPLIGSGLAGIGLPANQIIQLILISLLKSTKENEMSTTVNIILRDELRNDVDLELIKHNWK